MYCDGRIEAQREHHLHKALTRLAWPQAPARQPEVVAALQQQHVREPVLLHQQHRLHAAPRALLRIPAPPPSTSSASYRPCPAMLTAYADLTVLTHFAAWLPPMSKTSTAEMVAARYGAERTTACRRSQYMTNLAQTKCIRRPAVGGGWVTCGRRTVVGCAGCEPPRKCPWTAGRPSRRSCSSARGTARRPSAQTWHGRRSAQGWLPRAAAHADVTVMKPICSRYAESCAASEPAWRPGCHPGGGGAFTEQTLRRTFRRKNFTQKCYELVGRRPSGAWRNGDVHSIRCKRSLSWIGQSAP